VSPLLMPHVHHCVGPVHFMCEGCESDIRGCELSLIGDEREARGAGTNGDQREGDEKLTGELGA
jgi:hypothetical protein